MKKMILLNITDPDMSVFICRLQALFNNKSNSLPHITFRGPYLSSPSKSVLNKLQQFVDSIHEAQIDGVAMFDNGDEFFVYFKVQIQDLEKLSWKKDFPRKDYGFNPHVTLYKGKDRQYAKDVFDFLNGLDIQEKIKHFELTSYRLGDRQVPIAEESIGVLAQRLQSYLNKTKQFLQTARV